MYPVPEGPNESSPTPQSDSTELAEVLRRDRRGWLRKPLAVGRAVVCEGGLARSAWKKEERRTFSCLNVHCVFSTKERVPILNPEVRKRLWPYLWD